jgi:hypothetical protein
VDSGASPRRRRLRPRQVVDVIGGGFAPGEDLIEFTAKSASDVGIFTQQIPRPRQSGSRGFEAGAQEGHQLVADLQIAVAVAGFRVFGGEQERQQVAGLLDLSAAVVGDQAVEEPLDAAQPSHSSGSEKRCLPA